MATKKEVNKKEGTEKPRFIVTWQYADLITKINNAKNIMELSEYHHYLGNKYEELKSYGIELLRTDTHSITLYTTDFEAAATHGFIELDKGTNHGNK